MQHILSINFAVCKSFTQRYMYMYVSEYLAVDWTRYNNFSLWQLCVHQSSLGSYCAFQ